jgi:hypothetical protein
MGRFMAEREINGIKPPNILEEAGRKAAIIRYQEIAEIIKILSFKYFGPHMH